MPRAHEYHYNLEDKRDIAHTRFHPLYSLRAIEDAWRWLICECIWQNALIFWTFFWNYNPLCKAHEYHYNLEDSGPNCHAILSRKRGPTIIISSWRFTRILNFKKSRPPFRTCAWKKLFAGSRDSFCCLRLKFELQHSNSHWPNYNKLLAIHENSTLKKSGPFHRL